MSRSLRFQHILTPGGMERHKRLIIDNQGLITAIEDEPREDGQPFDGWVALPGMPNAHSHCFQRALVGQGERASGDDSFWSWREAMYGLARDMSPENLRAVAARSFADMLRCGFTSVAEFHYLHHRADGSRGPEMAQAVIEGAAQAGIRLLLLPVLYQQGGFEQAAETRQQRFVHESVDDYLSLLASLGPLPLGIAPHSLRAVGLPALKALLAGADGLLPPGYAKHIHIAEQRQEVEACIEASGVSPIELLADAVELDMSWNLVHATHASERELALIADAGATVVLCPLTEAYLGDGIFPAREYRRLGGRFAIGSDSNVRIDAVEELRLLEYGQRLMLGRRACLATEEGLGAPLWRLAAVAGGAAMAQAVGEIRVGAYADLAVLDPLASPLAGLSIENVMDALITAGSRQNISATYVGGNRLVSEGSHFSETEIQSAYSAALKELASA
ncbi:MAG: formimidoylglutamate deiminase [Gammaproteobacteria bacterium]